MDMHRERQSCVKGLEQKKKKRKRARNTREEGKR